MFANMGFVAKILVIGVLGYQLFSNCGVCGVEDCNAKLDMVIVVDASFSVGRPNFRRVKDFIKSLIEHLPVQSDWIRISVVRYASRVDVISYLNNQTSKSEKIAAVESMRYRFGKTFTHEALELTRTDVLTPEKGDRPDVPNLVIVATDGASQDESLTTAAALALKADANLKIFVIGISSEVVDRELMAMASRPEMVFKLKNFTQLTQILETLARFSCSDMKEDSISQLKSWSNSNSGFIASTTKASSASKTSSPSQHPSTSSTLSERPSTASSTPSQPPSTASSTPSQRPSTASSTPSQRPSTASSTPSQQPSTASSTSSQRPSTASSTSSQRPSTASSTPSSTTFTSTLTSATFPSTTPSTDDILSPVLSTTFNLLTNMTPLPSTEFESSDDTASLSTRQEQTRDANEDLYNSNLTANTTPVTLHSMITSESGGKTESTPEHKTVSRMTSTLFDAKTTRGIGALSSTHILSNDISHARSTETPSDSTALTSEDSTTPLLSTDSETGDFGGLGITEDSTQNQHTKTTYSTTYVTTTAKYFVVSTDVSRLNKVYDTTYTIPVSTTNRTFNTSISQRSMAITPSLPTQTTSVGMPTHASTLGSTAPPFHVYTQLTSTSKKPRRKNKTLTVTVSTEAVSKTTKSVLSQSSKTDSQTSTRQITTGVQQPTGKLISRTSNTITQTSVGKSQTQFPPGFSSTESSSAQYHTSEDSRTTYDSNDHQAVLSTQKSTVVVEYETYEEHGNTSSINTTVPQDMLGEDGGDISSRDVYIFVAGGSATAIVVTAMGTFLAVLCRRRDSKRHMDTEL